MIKTRFAPSPTGFLHVGNLRTLLFSYLFAKKHGGTFLVRIEDTDQERLVEGGIEGILRVLDIAGISIDEGVHFDSKKRIQQKGENGPYIQSQRLDIYKQYVTKLLENGHAYYAFDSSEELEKMRERQTLNKQATKYDRANMVNQITLGEEETKRRIAAGNPYVIRLRVPDNQIIEFNDLVRGAIKIHSKEVDDQILLKSDGFPTYHFAVVVDDHLMGVTHIIRGEEWISSTPKHVLLYKAFGWEQPLYAHLPLLINEKKQKMSKRHGDVFVEDFIAKGYLPEALVNFIAFLGWNPGDDREIFSLKELEQAFSIDQVGKAAAVFNKEKLDWYNKQYMMTMDLAELTKKAIPFFKNAGVLDKDEIDEPAEFEQLMKAVVLERGRANTLVELVRATGFIFADELVYDPELLVWKKSTKEDAKERLSGLLDFLKTIPEGEWQQVGLEEMIKSWIAEKGFSTGEVLWPVRVALSGLKNSPGPFEIANALGKEKSLTRLLRAIEKL